MKSSDFALRTDNNFRWLNFPVLDEYDFILHGFIIKSQASPGKKIPKPERFFEELIHPTRPVVSLQQVHQDGCIVISAKDKIKKRYEGDAILTDRKDLLISIQVADCVPIFLVEEKRKVIGLIHAGWKGTLLGIARNTLVMARSRLNCSPGKFTVMFGPSIRDCCYRVSDDVVILFDDKFSRRSARRGRRLDLIGINMQQLLSCGIKKDRMFTTGSCTVCDKELFHSYRREKEKAGRMIGFLGLK